MSKMIKELNEMRDAQKELDNYILGDRPYDTTILNQNKIALVVEVGELMNELPSYFKHWKKNPIDNRKKALEEYVDVLHFMLSIMNYNRVETDVYYHTYEDQRHTSIYEIPDILESVIVNQYEPDGLRALFELGNIIGFTWDEIRDTYYKKNKINHDRQDGGY